MGAFPVGSPSGELTNVARMLQAGKTYPGHGAGRDEKLSAAHSTDFVSGGEEELTSIGMVATVHRKQR